MMELVVALYADVKRRKWGWGSTCEAKRRRWGRGQRSVRRVAEGRRLARLYYAPTVQVTGFLRLKWFGLLANGPHPI
jgi:hypothetical protein